MGYKQTIFAVSEPTTQKAVKDPAATQQPEPIKVTNTVYADPESNSSAGQKNDVAASADSNRTNKTGQAYPAENSTQNPDSTSKPGTPDYYSNPQNYTQNTPYNEDSGNGESNYVANNSLAYYDSLTQNQPHKNENDVTDTKDNPIGVPIVRTGPATEVGVNSVTLIGTVNGQGGATDAWFEFSTKNLISQSSSVLAAGPINKSVSRRITGLSSRTTYYYKICAQNNLGISCGSILSFSTQKGTVTTSSKGGSTKIITTTDTNNTTVVERNSLVSGSTWTIIIRSTIFLLVIFLAIFLAIRIFHSGH